MKVDNKRYRQILYDKEKNCFIEDTVESGSVNKQVLITAQNILQIISRVFGIEIPVMLSNNRKRELVFARMIFFHWMRDRYKSALSFADLAAFAEGGGQKLVDGEKVPMGKNHSTIVHALREESNLLSPPEDKEYLSYFQAVEMQMLFGEMEESELQMRMFSYEDVTRILEGNGVLRPFISRGMVSENCIEEENKAVA